MGLTQFGKRLVRDAIANLWRFFFLSDLAVCSLGKDSRVNYWRIRASKDGILKVGSQSLIRSEFVFERPNVEIVIGDRTFIGRGLFTIAERLEVGNDVMISWGVTISDHNSHSLKFSERANDVVNALAGVKYWDAIKVAPVRIENKVWLGFGCSILKGVTIGEGAIVAANSVVTKDVDPWTIVAGNPAKLIREIPENER